MKNQIPIALQLYSVRDACAKNGLPETLKQVAQMGYDGVEFAGYYGHTPEELVDLCTTHKLEIAGVHTRIDTLTGDALEKTIDFNKKLGNKYLIIPIIRDERIKSKSGWLEIAEQLNDISDRCAEENMMVGFHNHMAEFEKLDGEYPWDLLFGNTDDRVVMQVDSGNALCAGVDVVQFLERYPNRAKTVHLKEFSKNNETALIGEGDVSWTKIFDACETVGGTEWYVVEQEKYPNSSLEGVEICLKNLRKMQNER